MLRILTEEIDCCLWGQERRRREVEYLCQYLVYITSSQAACKSNRMLQLPLEGDLAVNKSLRTADAFEAPRESLEQK